MKINRMVLALAAILVILTILACDAGNLIALGGGTATPTRTPRPTFTPRPSFSPTPEDTATPDVTATNTAAPSPTTAARTVAPTLRPATAKPAAPTAVPAPQFAWHQRPDMSVQGRCDAGPSVFEIKGRIHDGSTYVEGIHVVVLNKTGQVAVQTDSWGPISMNPEWGVSCFEPKNSYNYQIDISAARDSGPLTIRLTRGKNDLTPISTDIKFDVTPGGGRWYFDWSK